MSVKITSANTNKIANGARVIVRNSSGIPYVIVEDTNDESIEVWKGNGVTPTAWTEQDTSNNPDATVYGSASVAIDSNDVIHIAYMYDNGKVSQLKYVQFRADGTNDDFQNDAVVIADIGEDPVSVNNLRTAIAIDSSDVPHIAYNEYVKNAAYPALYYVNKVGGSWNTKVEIEGGSGTEHEAVWPDICMDADDKPCVAYLDFVDKNICVAQGGVNNATSFTLYDIETGADGYTPMTWQPVSIAVDSSGNHHVAFSGGSGSDLDLKIREHVYGNSWNNWETTETVDDISVSGNGIQRSITLTIDGTDRYILYRDVSASDIVYYADTGSGWGSQQSLETGTYQDVKAKFGFWVDNDSGGSLINVVDSYDYSNQDGVFSLDSSLTQGKGQNFTADGSLISSCYFWLKKDGAPTGNAVAKIYNYTGTFGSSCKPTGSPLATSDNFDVSALTTSFQPIRFNFATPYQSTNGSHYFICIEYSGGDINNSVEGALDNSSPTHAGNAATLQSGTWYVSASDVIFLINTRSSASELDYVFSDGTDIYWNKLTLGTSVTEKNVSDTGSGTDGTPSIVNSFTLQETGSGSEVLNFLNTLGTLLETGSGADTVDSLVGVDVQETASGVETSDILNQLTQSDSGSGADNISELLNQLSQLDSGTSNEVVALLKELATIQDTATASDIIQQIINLFSQSDSGAGADLASILNELQVTDTGTGTETITNLIMLTLAESGTASDVISVLAEILSSDSGIGADTLELIKGIDLSDSGTSSDNITTLIELSLTDSGAGTELLNILAEIALSETGTGSETVSAEISIDVSDTGLGTEALDLFKMLLLSESGSGLEALSILNEFSVSDTATGNDTLQVLVELALQDTGTALEVLSLLRILTTISDSGAGTETLTKFVEALISETGSGAETLGILNQFSLQETGSGSDSVNKTDIGSEKNVSDTASGADTASILGEIQITDLATATDAIAGLLNSFTVNDSGSGSDIIQLLNSIQVSDIATATDLLDVLAEIGILDNATGNEVLSLLAEIGISDDGSGAEALDMLNSLNLSDTATASETIGLLNMFILLDSGAGIDSPSIEAIITLLDSATGDDIAYVLKELALQDTGAGADVISEILAEITIQETATGSELIDVFIPSVTEKLVSDTGEGLDSLTKALVEIYLRKTGKYRRGTNPYNRKNNPYKLK